jgi:serralysin
MTRGGVLAGFSESAENITNYASQLALGLWDIDETAASVARLYHGTLDRAPDAGGLGYWTSQLKTGAQTLLLEAGAFVGSTEFQATYGSLNNSQFVNQLYLNVLDRAADAGGLSYWTGLLNGGTSRAEVTLGFTESGEFQVNILGQIENGIVLL